MQNGEERKKESKQTNDNLKSTLQIHNEHLDLIFLNLLFGGCVGSILVVERIDSQASDRVHIVVKRLPRLFVA
jgi:hypothetical protein